MEQEVDQFQQAFRRIAGNVNLVIHGKADVVRMALVAVFAVRFLGERPAIRDWIGIGMIAAGVLILAFGR